MWFLTSAKKICQLGFSSKVKRPSSAQIDSGNFSSNSSLLHLKVCRLACLNILFLKTTFLCYKKICTYKMNKCMLHIRLTITSVRQIACNYIFIILYCIAKASKKKSKQYFEKNRKIILTFDWHFCNISSHFHSYPYPMELRHPKSTEENKQTC